MRLIGILTGAFGGTTLDHFGSKGLTIEVVDLDGNRVDQVLMMPMTRTQMPTNSNP